jgi:peptide/nickel transport system permease protein
MAMLAVWAVPTMLAGVLLSGLFVNEQYWHCFHAATLSRREALDMPFLRHRGSVSEVLVLLDVTALCTVAMGAVGWRGRVRPAGGGARGPRGGAGR